ncbi:MAG: DUF1653 domain-containing protein [Clostridium sp.]
MKFTMELQDNMDIYNNIGKVFRHFKGDLYLLIDIGIHSETEEEMVIYKALYGEYRTYVRPLNMFISEVDKNKYPNIAQRYRFQIIEINSVKNNM